MSTPARRSVLLSVVAALIFVLPGVVAPSAQQVPITVAQIGAAHHLMPVPAKLALGEGGLPIDARFAVAFTGFNDPRLEAAGERLVQRITRQTGIPIVAKGGMVALVVKCEGRGRAVPAPVEDERYSLEVTSGGATLSAPTPYGVLRGLETFAQLVEPGAAGWVVRAVTIEDQPRFPWRGLLIDACRHWLPVDVIKRNLDAMAAVKLNVLHWHLSEDQGFRVESRLYPKLQGEGSDGHYYTQAQIRDVVRYAADRGIRVMPEFDIPGHTTSWLVGYPELSAGPGPYQLQRTWGVFDPVMDPTSERVYLFLDRFLGEMAALFPDQYFHIGGDEVNGRQWNANPRIQAFKKRRGLKSNAELHTYFNRRISAILKKHGKKMIGWDEIFNPGLPKDTVIQSWRGQKSLAEAARAGYQGILSNGYYLDYIWPAARHYAVDPLGKDAAALPDAAKGRILGGEACMWAEWVTPETVDSRIWPRAAAIAERYWSPALVTDAADMYRRLAVVGQRLTFTGVTHRTHYQSMLERLAGHGDVETLKTLVDLVEPLREYGRGRGMQQTSLSPLTRVIDAARPESEEAAAFDRLVTGLLADPARQANREAIERELRRWQRDAARLEPMLGTWLLQEARPLAASLELVSSLGLRALAALDGRTKLTLSAGEAEGLARAGRPAAEVLLMVTAPVKRLIDAAAGVEP